MAYVGGYTQRLVIQPITAIRDRANTNQFHCSISIRGTEDEGVFSFIIAATLEKNLEEICASRKALIETIRKFTGQRADIKLGNILWVSPYRSVGSVLDRDLSIWCLNKKYI